MRHCLAVMVCCAAAPALAQDWRPLAGDDIAAALAERTLIYDPELQVQQRFFASGRTEYTFGNPRWGWWEVRDDAYCSLWPPSDEWECFALALSADGRSVRFTGVAGDETVGDYSE